jgi:F-type H+-transporting ATPase subunit b
MDLVTPDIGLIFWTTISFIVLVVILGKFAWKPILKSVNDREKSIREALSEADKARQEMQNINADNERILKEARIDRDAMLKDARDIKNNLIEDAKEEAKVQANKIVEQARTTIEHEKLAAITDLKNQVADLSIDIAEKIIKNELSNKDKQIRLVENMLDDVKLS